MSERQIIRVVIRIVGLLGILYVVRHWAFLYHKHNGSIHFEQGEWWKLIAEICLVLIGLYMVAGAPLLLKLIIDNDSDKNPKI